MAIFDLSHPLNNNMPVYPGDPEISLNTPFTLEADGFNLTTMKSGMHTGTHLDLPRHATADPKTLQDYPVAFFMGQACCLDLNPDAKCLALPEPSKLSALPKTRILLLHTGWSAHFNHPGYFEQSPWLSEALVRFIVNRGIEMLGMDFPSPDPPGTLDNHRHLAAAGMVLVENLTGLASLKGCRRFFFSALPLNLPAEASLVRAVAMTDDH